MGAVRRAMVGEGIFTGVSGMGIETDGAWSAGIVGADILGAALLGGEPGGGDGGVLVAMILYSSAEIVAKGFSDGDIFRIVWVRETG